MPPPGERPLRERILERLRRFGPACGAVLATGLGRRRCSGALTDALARLCETGRIRVSTDGCPGDCRGCKVFEFVPEADR